MTRPDNCSFINGEYVKSGLEKLEVWCLETNEEVLFPQSTVFFLLLLSSISLTFWPLVFDSMLAHPGMNSNIPDRLLDSWYVVKLVFEFLRNLTVLESTK